MIPTERTQVTWPQIVSDVDPEWLDELDEITPDQPGFDSLEATPHKLATLISPISNEVIDDSEPSAVEVLNQHLVTMLALKLDASIFEGDGGSAPGIVGLANIAGKQTVSMGNDGAELTNYDPIIEAIGKLRDANVPGPYAIAAHGSVLTQLELLKEGTDSSKQLGAPAALPPFYTSSQLSITETQGNASDARSIYVYAPGQIVLVRRKSATPVELDRPPLQLRRVGDAGILRADLLTPNPVRHRASRRRDPGCLMRGTSGSGSKLTPHSASNGGTSRHRGGCCGHRSRYFRPRAQRVVPARRLPNGGVSKVERLSRRPAPREVNAISRGTRLSGAAARPSSPRSATRTVAPKARPGRVACPRPGLRRVPTPETVTRRGRPIEATLPAADSGRSGAGVAPSPRSSPGRIHGAPHEGWPASPLPASPETA